MKRNLISLLVCLLLIVCLCLPVLAYDATLPRIIDNADLLTHEEEADLESYAASIRDTYDMDVVILTVDSLGGKSARTYAEDYYDSHGYGVGASGDGVLLLIAMDTREWYISTCGSCIHAISDYDVYDLFDVMSGDLSGGRYFEAFSSYLGALPGYFLDYRENASSGNYDSGYSGNAGSTAVFDGQMLLVSLMVGLVGGGIGLLILRGMMNSKRAQHGASDYLEKGSYDLRVQRDIFLYSRVTKTPRPKNTSSGGRSGGGGRSHGGGGGRF